MTDKLNEKIEEAKRYINLEEWKYNEQNTEEAFSLIMYFYGFLGTLVSNDISQKIIRIMNHRKSSQKEILSEETKLFLNYFLGIIEKQRKEAKENFLKIEIS